MKNPVKIAMVLILLTLTACGTTPVPTQTTVIDTPHINPPLPLQVELQPVNFKVYTATDLKQLSTQKNVVLFTLTKDQYAALGKNLAAIHGYILQLKQDVIFYRNQNAASNPAPAVKK